MPDTSPNMDLSKGFWVVYCVVADGNILPATLCATADECKTKTERLLQRPMPPNWVVEDVVVVRRRA